MSVSSERFCARVGMTDKQLERHLNPRRGVSRAEQLRRFSSAAFTLYWRAEHARKRGLSWRNFCVGCAVWAFRKDAYYVERRWWCFTGMNTKVEENSRNICAEPVALGAALASEYTEIIGMVVVGQPQADESGKTHPTLRPCAHCRLLMKNHPLITPRTIIVTATPPPREIDSLAEVPYEVHTFQKLLEEYGET
jgi:cytidine deaminase